MHSEPSRRPGSTWTDPTGDVTTDVSAWSGRLAFGPWWFLYSGPVGPTDAHAHHAYQIVVHGGSPVVADGAGHLLAGPVVVLDPDATHAFRDHRNHVVIVYVDPESVAGNRLRRDRVERPFAAEAHPVSALVTSLRPDNWSRAEDAVQRILDHLCGSVERSMMSWWRHPAIDAALARLPDLVDEGTVDVKQLADEMGLSVSRLTHVFSEEIGTPSVRMLAGCVSSTPPSAWRAAPRSLRRHTTPASPTDPISPARSGRCSGWHQPKPSALVIGCRRSRFVQASMSVQRAS